MDNLNFSDLIQAMREWHDQLIKNTDNLEAVHNKLAQAKQTGDQTALEVAAKELEDAVLRHQELVVIHQNHRKLLEQLLKNF